MDIRDILLSIFSGLWYFKNTSFKDLFEKSVATFIFALLTYALIFEFQKQWNRLMHKKGERR